MTQNTETDTYQEIVRIALGLDWGNTEAQARRVAEHAANRIIALLAERDAARAEVARLDKAVALLRRADMQVAWESLGLGNAFAEEVESALANTTTPDAITKTWNEAIDAAAKVCDERGVEEQKNFGLGRATQNYYRARDAIRKLKKGE